MKLGQVIEEEAFDKGKFREWEFKHVFPVFRGQTRRSSKGDKQVKNQKGHHLGAQRRKGLKKEVEMKCVKYWWAS